MKNRTTHFCMFLGFGILILIVIAVCYFHFYQSRENDLKPITEVSMYLADDLFRLLYWDQDYGKTLEPYYQYDIVYPSTFSMADKNSFVLYQLFRFLPPDSNQSISKHTKEEILNLKNQILGVDTPFEIISFDSLSCQQFYLDDTGNYEIEWECGDMQTPTYSPEIISAYQQEDIVTLEQKVVFFQSDFDTDGIILSIYRDYDRTELLDQIHYSNSDEYLNAIFDISALDYQNASQYRFIFKKNDNETYQFLKFERILEIELT